MYAMDGSLWCCDDGSGGHLHVVGLSGEEIGEYRAYAHAKGR